MKTLLNALLLNDLLSFSVAARFTSFFYSSFLQILDHYFGNVCELDLVFGFHKVYCILDEFIIGGEVQETSKKVILERLREISALET
jgi:Clathrin adaptor complex small chain